MKVTVEEINNIEERNLVDIIFTSKDDARAKMLKFILSKKVFCESSLSDEKLEELEEFVGKFHYNVRSKLKISESSKRTFYRKYNDWIHCEVIFMLILDINL